MDNWSKAMAEKIGDILNLPSERKSIITYGLIVLTHNLIGIIVVIAISYFTGALRSTVAMVATLLILRPSAGGAHCSTSFNCNLFGYIIMPLLGAGAFWVSGLSSGCQSLFLIFCLITALIGMALKSPFFIQIKPRAMLRSKILKTRAIILALLLTITSVTLLLIAEYQWSMGIAMGLLFQGIMLLPPGVKGALLFDNIVNLALSKGGEKE